MLTDAILDTLRERFDLRIELVQTAIENENFPVMRALRDVPLTKEDMAFVNGDRPLAGERTL